MRPIGLICGRRFGTFVTPHAFAESCRMGKCLTDERVRQFENQGFLAPLLVLTESDTAKYRGSLEAAERRVGGPFKGALRHKSHIVFAWLADLVRHAAILDAVEDIIGPDILVWNTNFFIKEPRDPGFVSWHQDSTYWGLSKPDGVTAWVALSASSIASGCMSVLPHSHTRDQLPHVDRPHEHNLLTRGQEAAVDVDSGELVALPLRPGEMSLHHVRIVHGSGPNRTDDRRIGIAIRYIPTDVRQLHGRDTATLVRGTDRFGHFDPEPVPSEDFQPDCVAAHAAIVDRHTALLLKGSAPTRLK